MLHCSGINGSRAFLMSENGAVFPKNLINNLTGFYSATMVNQKMCMDLGECVNTLRFQEDCGIVYSEMFLVRFCSLFMNTDLH